MDFINNQSWKCLLGPQAKIIEHDSLFVWQVGKKFHFSTDHKLNDLEINYLKTYNEISFHYINKDNFDILNNIFKLEKDRNISVSFNIEDLSFKGRKYHGIRWAINKNKNKFELLDNYKNINDVKVMLKSWSLTSGEKYFRDFSGKNFYFINNNFHVNNIPLFIYDGAKLISFGVLSNPEENWSSYIIGKALCKEYPGLSEFTDIELYKKGIEQGVKNVNLGQATKGLVYFKEKFPNSIETIHYNGKIKGIK